MVAFMQMAALLQTALLVQMAALVQTAKSVQMALVEREMEWKVWAQHEESVQMALVAYVQKVA
jgi:hypothetical protein